MSRHPCGAMWGGSGGRAHPHIRLDAQPPNPHLGRLSLKSDTFHHVIRWNVQNSTSVGSCQLSPTHLTTTFVPRIPNPIPPFLATVLVPSPWSMLISRCFSAERCITLAMNACQSDPSSAHFAKTL